MAMKEVIEGLLKDWRLAWLDPQAKFHLLNMLKSLEDGQELNREQNNYLQWIEEHIKNIDPHIEIIQVGGEDVPVQFATRRMQ
jgi:hypothetical protein